LANSALYVKFSYISRSLLQTISHLTCPKSSGCIKVIGYHSDFTQKPTNHLPV